MFSDRDSNNLAVTDIIAVDKVNKTYCRYPGSFGLESSELFLINPEYNSIIVVCRSGDVAIINQNELSKIDLSIKSDCRFYGTIIKKKLCTIGQVFEMLVL